MSRSNIRSISGLLRNLDASVGRMARESIKRERKAQRELALLNKENELLRNQAEVEAFEDTIDTLKSIHHYVGNTYNWNEIANIHPPMQPINHFNHEREATIKWEKFRPSLLQIILGTGKKAKSKLKKLILEARVKDTILYEKSLIDYKTKYEEWTQLIFLATSINNGDTSAYRNAILNINPFRDLEDLGCIVSFRIRKPLAIKIYLSISNGEIIPDKTKSLTSRGKISLKNMPKTQRSELYQDYVCGCAIRSAREIFALLPIKQVIVDVQTRMINTMTGIEEEKTILSAVFTEHAFSKIINYERTDASDAINHFTHRMEFKKNKGFLIVEPLEESDYPTIL